MTLTKYNRIDTDLMINSQFANQAVQLIHCEGDAEEGQATIQLGTREYTRIGRVERAEGIKHQHAVFPQLMLDSSNFRLKLHEMELIGDGKHRGD